MPAADVSLTVARLAITALLERSPETRSRLTHVSRLCHLLQVIDFGRVVQEEDLACRLARMPVNSARLPHIRDAGFAPLGRAQPM